MMILFDDVSQQPEHGRDMLFFAVPGAAGQGGGKEAQVANTLKIAGRRGTIPRFTRLALPAHRWSFRLIVIMLPLVPVVCSIDRLAEAKDVRQASR
jgi:hypothetical protein